MTGLNATRAILSANSCSLEEVEQRRVAVDRALVEVAADRDAALARPRARTFSMILSKVPWPPRSGRMRLWVS